MMPVLTWAKWPRVTGVLLPVLIESLFLTTITFMMEMIASGSEYIAKTGSATTHPADCMRGTF